MKINEIWSLYRNSLKAFLSSKLSNPDDADDLLQEVLIKTHQSIGELKNSESIKSWLFQIANRTVIDFYRKQGQINYYESGELWYGESDFEVKAELAHCLEPFLTELPQELADLLRAVDLEGKPQKAQAQELGLSYSTLKSRVQKGRNELRGLFERCCHFKLDNRGNLIDFEQKPNHCKKC